MKVSRHSSFELRHMAYRSLLKHCDCLLCLDPLIKPATSFLCHSCADALRPRHPACPHCGEPMSAGSTGRCQRCQRQSPTFDYTHFHCLYEGPVRQWIQQAKDQYQEIWMRRLADWMSRHPPASLAQVDALVPVPSYWRRRLVRGFNPAFTLARQIHQQHGIPLRTDIIQRRRTGDQRGLRRNQRQALSTESYSIRPIDLTGQHLLVIDDVMTTGATLERIAQLLKQQGAAITGNWVLARTPAKSLPMTAETHPVSQA